MGYLSTGATAPKVTTFAARRIAADDFNGMAIAQRNEARARYGSTTINLPGRSDIQWPNVSGKFAASVLEHWVRQLNTLSGITFWDVAQFTFPPIAALRLTMWAVKPTSAAQLAWERALAEFQAKAKGWHVQGVLLGNKLFPEADAAEFWLTIANMAERMRGVSQRPSDWEIFGESVSEAIAELPGRIKDVARWSGLDTLLKWGFYGALAFGGVMLLPRILPPKPRQNPRRRRR